MLSLQRYKGLNAIYDFRSWFQGVDLSQSDYDGRTPLHLAAAEGRYECVNFLLKLVEVYPKPLDRYFILPNVINPNIKIFIGPRNIVEVIFFLIIG